VSADSAIDISQKSIDAIDGHKIETYRWRAAQDTAGCETPAAVIQILHGLGEHAARYERFAISCVANGFAVIAHNHRGHDTRSLRGHFADRNGWEKVIEDVATVHREVSVMWPRVPVALFGHSMGSFIAQSFVLRFKPELNAMVLSGSTLTPGMKWLSASALSALLVHTQGRQRKSKLLNSLGLGRLNKPFEPARTPFDWLSRDIAEVDSYIADPRCGGAFTNQLWRDLSGGLAEISSVSQLRAIATSLPVLIVGGDTDPVGGAKGLSRLAAAYQLSGHKHVDLKIYPDGRHEMLNEINRDEVTADVLSWLDEIRKLSRNSE